MRILITANSAWNIANFRRDLISALQADGHEVTILAPPDETVRKLTDAGLDFRPLRMEAKSLNLLGELRLFQALQRAFKTPTCPDVVLSFTIKNNLWGAFAAQRLGIPFVPNVTGLGTAFLSHTALHWLATFLYRRAFRRLPLIFFQNADDRNLFVQLGIARPDQAEVLPGSGVNLTQFTASPVPELDDGTVFLMIARIIRDKGVLEYIEAAKTLKVRYPEARFQLLGGLAAKNRTAISVETIHKAVAEGAIEYLGEVTDVRPHIRAAHCVVLPSYREGKPRTLIEAAAIGRPLVATDVPGCRDLVRSGKNGVLCQARNVNGLVHALEEILNKDDDVLSQMGQASRDLVEREYDVQNIINIYRAVLKDVAKGVKVRVDQR